MFTSPRFHFWLAGVAGLLLAAQPLQAADWPQFRGPNRDDVSLETGLLKQWPEGGPKRAWLYDKAGLGYAGFSVAGGKLFTLGTRDDLEVLLALDATTGKELWVLPLGGVLANNWGDGPRGTPAVAGEHVYALSGEGILACATVADGKEVWRRNLMEMGAKKPSWGFTESPLVDGDQVICTPGGEQGTLAALDAKTGATRWQTQGWKDPAQYASVVKATIQGKPQHVQLTMQTLAGVDPKDGTVLWQTPFPGKTAVIPTPIIKDDHVFVTAGYEVGCKMVKVEPDFKVTTVYENKLMKNHHGGVVLVGDHLYGHSDRLGWMCMSFLTGEQVWLERSLLGKGAVSVADGHLYCLDEAKGTVALAEASPKGWVEHGRLTLDPQSSIRSPKGKIWTHPVVANGKLYLRDQEFIYCYDVKQQ